MRKRRWLWAGTFLLIALLAVLLDPTCVLVGLIRNERFYQHRPTTYWSRAIQQLRPDPQSNPVVAWIMQLRGRFFPESSGEEKKIPLLDGGLEAEPVLRELLQDRVPFVRSTAAFALLKAGAVQPKDVIRVLCDALLDAEDYGTRYCAASSLEDLGPPAEAAIPALIVALGDTGGFMGSNADFVHRKARRTLDRLGAAAVPALIGALDHKDPFIRICAAHTLGDIGLEADAAVPRLFEALEDRSLRVAAVRALWQMDVENEQVLRAILQALRDPDHEIRAEAAEVLGEISTGASRAVPALVIALHDEDAVVRARAARVLSEFSPEAKVAIPELIRAFQDSDGSVRSAAIGALEGLGCDRTAAVSALIKALADPEPYVRSSAARTLAALGPEAGAAVSALSKALEDRAIDCDAAEALGRIGPDASAAIPALLRAMKSPDKDGHRSNLRLLATSALAEIRPKDEASIRELLSAWKDDWEDARSRAVKALAAIGPAAIPHVTGAMKHGDTRVRAQAVLCMSEMAQHFVEQAIPPLREALGDSDINIRASAALALSKVDPHYERLVPALCELLRSRSSTCWDIFPALASLGADAEGAIPVLSELLKDDGLAVGAAHALWKIDQTRDERVSTLLRQLGDRQRRSGAAASLGKLGPAAEPAVPAVIAALRSDSDWGVRSEAAEALAEIGAAATVAIPALIEALADHNPRVQASAAQALGSFGSKAAEAVPALREARDREVQATQTGEAHEYYWEQAITSARAAIVRAIWQINGQAEEAVPRLVLLLKHADEAAQRLAADTLALIGPEARAAVPALVWAMKHGSGNHDVAPAAAAALGAIGPEAKQAVPALVKAFKKRNPQRTWYFWLFDRPEKLARAAATALLKIDREAASKAGVMPGAANLSEIR